MATLQIKHKEIDLDKVHSLSEEDYQGLLFFAGQWDDPDQGAWLETIEKARITKTNKPEPKPKT